MRPIHIHLTFAMIRRGIFIFCAALMFWFSFSNVVDANNGPHGNYTATTDKCAACHRTHTASQANLLRGRTIAELCLSCHGSGGNGANTNVADGRYEANGAALNGGGFVNFRGTPTTSAHTYDGTVRPAWGANTPWSSNTGCLGCHSDASGLRWPGIPEWFPGPGAQPGQIAGAGNVQMGLTCISCHDPHGSRSYRILQNRLHPNPIEYQDPTMPGYVQVVSNEPGGLNPNLPGYTPDYTVANYRDGINSWCAGCHFLYLQTQSTTPFDAADGKGAQIRYRHRILSTTPAAIGLTTSLPLQQPAGKFGCITCHFAHGTNAQITGYASNVAPTNDSALLRLDNRGVCQDCHKK